MNQNIALIRNPTSRLNQKEDTEFTQFAYQWLGDNYCVPTSIQEVIDTIKKLAAKKVNCIIIDGGDGTISRVMTGIYHAYPEGSFPYLVILPSGNTNLIAKDIGFGVRGKQALQRIKILSERGRLINSVQHRHALKIEWEDPQKLAVLGMFQGAAAFTRAINIAHGPTISKYFPHDAAVVVTIVTSLLKLLCADTRKKWMKGEPCVVKFRDNNIETQQKGSFLFLATTLQSFSRNIWPFFDKNCHEQRVHFLNVKPYPPHLLRACWAFLRGKVPAWLRDNSNYQSGTADQITLDLQQEIILDGEHFDTGNGHCVHLSAGPQFSFVRL